MIIDLIAVTVVFGAGFWCGKTFKTPRAMYDAAKKKAKELTS